MKIKLSLFFITTLIVIVIFTLFLYGCISYNIPPRKSFKQNLKRGKREPLIRLLLLKGEKFYHILTDSPIIYIETLNNNENSGRGFDKNSIHAKILNIVINGNSAIIQNRKFILPIKIENLSKFDLNNIDLSGNLIIYKDFIILEMPIETYIEGVVASEVGVDWPLEALKAQAVVSRTYAVYNMLHNFNKPYDLGTSEYHQKYRLKKNIANVKKAVESTRGIIIYYRSEPIQAFYHACSGGITESGGNVFLKDLPYLKSVRDPYSVNCPNSHWEIKLRSKVILRNLEGRIPRTLNTKQITDIQIGARTSSGRVKFFTLKFGKIRFNIKGNNFRLAMGPKTFKSLLITRIVKEHRKNNITIYEFIGKGYGHGVGMSQWGAKNMALQGFSYINIIKFYYRDVNLGKYNKLPIYGR